MIADIIDGVIKYNFDFELSKPLDEIDFFDIEFVRERLFALGLIGVTKDGIGYGNISKRVNRDSFIITGTQTGNLKHLNGSKYALIEEYNDKEFYLKSTGAIKPSSEALTHGTIYNLSEDIGAVIHIHSNPLWRFMLKGKYLKTDRVEYGSIEMIDEVNRIFSNIKPLDNSKFVMRGHKEGIIVFGRSLNEAEFSLFKILRRYLR